MWIYGILTGCMLGVLGIVCSAVVAILKTRLKYNLDNFIKILVAFAVGALLGDAMFHLLPESFGLEDEEDGKDKEEGLKS